MIKFIKGIFVGSIFRLIIYVISTVIKLTANIMIFFGLYVPFFYLLYGEALILFADFAILPYTADTGLYLFGLVLSLFCSVIITIKSLLVNPIKSIFGRDEKEDIPTPHYNNQNYYQQEPPNIERDYSEQYNLENRRDNYSPYRTDSGYFRLESREEFFSRTAGTRTHNESPDIYRSENNPDLVIYEYHNKYDIYRVQDNSLEYLETKPKYN